MSSTCDLFTIKENFNCVSEEEYLFVKLGREDRVSLTLSCEKFMLCYEIKCVENI